MKASIGLTGTHTRNVATELSKILADEFVLYVRTRNAHWNVEGSDFIEKHKFFESQFEQINGFIDSVAERIRALGHYTPATIASYLKLTQLIESNHEKNDSQGFIKALLRDHECIIAKLRGDIHRFADDWNDAGTSDFITGLMEDHEKMAWFLRAHL